MKIEKQNLENHEVQLDVTVEKEEFAPYMDRAARKIAGAQRIPGFRPGKAPASVIRNMFGELAIAQEAFDMFLEDKYSAILSEAEVEPGAMGRLEKVDDVVNPKFSLVVPLKATVDLGDYRSIREEYVEEELTDQEVEDALKQIKEPYASQEPAEGEIEKGEVVYVMIKGELDQPMDENGSTELVKEMPYHFHVGDDENDENGWPYPAYSMCLIGHKEGDVVTSSYTYPEDTPMTALKGRTATYTTTIQSVKKMVMPENDDDLAKNFGKDTFAELLEELKNTLSESKKRAQEDKYVEAVMKKMMELAKVEFSAAELKAEIEERLNELKESLKQRGIGFEAWLKMKKTDEEKLVEEEIKPVAEEQLKRKLILGEFARVEKIHMNFEKFQKKVQEFMAQAQVQLAQVKNKKQRQEMQNNVQQNALNESFLEEVFGRLIAIAKGENPEIEEEHSHDQEAAETAAKAAAEAAAEIEAEKAAAETPAEPEAEKKSEEDKE